MNKEELINELVDLMETGEELTEDSLLENIEEWDSLAKLSVMAIAKKEFSITLTSNQIKEFRTVGDICNTLLK